MPPRAADTNEPVAKVGAATAGAGSNGAGGAGGAIGVPAPVIDTGDVAVEVPDSSRVPNAWAPAAPAAAPAPRRRTARRLS
jgi:hypothetical protein